MANAYETGIHDSSIASDARISVSKLKWSNTDGDIGTGGDLASPSTGSIIYNSTDSEFQFYSGSAWARLIRPLARTTAQITAYAAADLSAGDLFYDTDLDLVAHSDGSDVKRSDSYFIVSMKADDAGTDASGGAVANTVIQAACTVPVACTVVNCRAVCATSDDANCTADIFEEDGSPATRLSAPIGLAAAVTDYAGSFASTSIAANTVLSLRAVVANTKVVTGMQVDILCKATAPATTYA